MSDVQKQDQEQEQKPRKSKAKKVTLIKNVKYGKTKYKIGDEIEVNADEFDMLINAGVIEEE